MSDSEYAKMMLVVCLLGVFILIVVCGTLYLASQIGAYQGPCPWLP